MTHRCHVSVRYSHKKSCTYSESKAHIDLSRQNRESESPLGHTDFFLYVMDVSYFSGKMDMYCRYKELNFMRVEPTFIELKEIGSQVPILYDNRPGVPDDKRWLRDTTPMIMYLETVLPPPEGDTRRGLSAVSEATLPAVLPSDEALSFMTCLLEDYADEGLWRPAMYFRWEPEYDRQASSLRFTYEFAREIPEKNLPLIIRPWVIATRQWLFSCYSEGIHTDGHKQEITAEYLSVLHILESVLDTQPFLGGQAPSLVDFGFSGSMFRHFASDTTPRKLMQQHAPGVFEWVGRLWNCKQSSVLARAWPGRAVDEDAALPGGLAAEWGAIFRQGHIRNYLRYLDANARAHAAGEKTFTWMKDVPYVASESGAAGGAGAVAGPKQVSYTVSTVPYRVWCYRQLQLQFCALRKSHNDRRDQGQGSELESAYTVVQRFLQRYDCYSPFFGHADEDTEFTAVSSEPEGGVEPPFCNIDPGLGHAKPVCAKWDEQPVFKSYIQTVLLPGLLKALLVLVVAILLWTHGAPLKLLRGETEL